MKYSGFLVLLVAAGLSLAEGEEVTTLSPEQWNLNLLRKCVENNDTAALNRAMAVVNREYGCTLRLYRTLIHAILEEHWYNPEKLDRERPCRRLKEDLTNCTDEFYMEVTPCLQEEDIAAVNLSHTMKTRFVDYLCDNRLQYLDSILDRCTESLLRPLTECLAPLLEYMVDDRTAISLYRHLGSPEGCRTFNEVITCSTPIINRCPRSNGTDMMEGVLANALSVLPNCSLDHHQANNTILKE